MKAKIAMSRKILISFLLLLLLVSSNAVIAVGQPIQNTYTEIQASKSSDIQKVEKTVNLYFTNS